MRRAQVAMEFIMTYGWAILVVLGAVGALAYFGVLDFDTTIPEHCILTTGFSCSNYEAYDQNNASTNAWEIAYEFKNGIGQDIVFECHDAPCLEGGVTLFVDDTQVSCVPAPGPFPVRIDNDHSHQFRCAVNTLEPEIGERIDARIDIIYMLREGSYNRTATGELVTTYKG